MSSEDNPYQPGAPAPAQPVARSARRQLLPVAVALLVASILHITLGLFYFAFVYNIVAAPDTEPPADCFDALLLTLRATNSMH